MKADRFADQTIVRRLAAEIADRAQQNLTIMEVCGTHTMCIAEYGLRSLLGPGIQLVSGPGCPVCVTDARLISAALAIAMRQDVIFTSFGDMLRVPAGKTSLLACRDQGAQVKLVLSPLDALRIAEENADKQVVFFAVGFETTAPLIAATILEAEKKAIANFTIIPANKTMPQALYTLLVDSTRIDGLLCPGHVAAITGSEAFAFVPSALYKPAAIAGFAAAEILLAVRAIVEMAAHGEPKLVNAYARAVQEEGNPLARRVMETVFQPCDAIWRGLGPIAGSGLALRASFAHFDALARFAETVAAAPCYEDHPACCCGMVLRGECVPQACPLFGTACRPEMPCGACMVSSEGACAAAYRYQEVGV